MFFMQKMPCFSRIMPYLKGKYNFGIQFQIKVSSWDIKQVILLQRIYKSKYLKEKPLNCAHFNLVLPLYPIPDNSDYMQLVETILSRTFIALQHLQMYQNSKMQKTKFQDHGQQFRITIFSFTKETCTISTIGYSTAISF